MSAAGAEPGRRVRRFERDGLSFDVLDEGPRGGEPVILLHGFPEFATSWSRVAPALHAAGYRTLAPDQRGYARRARPRGDRHYRLPVLVDDVLALADEAGLPAFHVVGHDWGGAVAWVLAGRHPERTLTLTSLSTPHPRAFARALLTSSQGRRSWYMAAFQVRGVAERQLVRDGGRRFVAALVRSGLPPEDARANIDRLLEPGAMAAVLSWYRAPRPGDLRDLRPVAVPTSYVWGSADVALGRRAADLTARYVTGPYRFHILHGATHWLPEASAEVVAPLLLDRLRSRPGLTRT